MFKQIANVAQLMKQAQAMQGRVQELKSRLETVRVTGQSFGVEVEVSGDLRVVDVRIPAEALADGVEELQRRVAEATNHALEMARQAAAEMMQSATGDLSGFGDLLSGIGSSK